ncbi:hypothetical protein ACQVP2_34220 [Methylobacterium aquaticum]|uniref:hypothetical protein n=1 Tax=Methylobacterium aquaticum TaxID=270351 RepID=UPI003D1719FD
MTIAPATLSEMIASTGFEEVRKAAVAELARLLKGVTVMSHPGKLDMNDVLAKAVVSAPGVAVGWGRLRAVRDLGGTYGLPLDFVAYIVTEDRAVGAGAAARRVERDLVAIAIGTRILRILADPDTASWGLTGLSAPLPDPEPEMRPVFTMKTAEQGTALFVVTWTQMLVDQGPALFGGPTPPVAGLPDGMEFEWPEGAEMPTELLAVFGDRGERR